MSTENTPSPLASNGLFGILWNARQAVDMFGEKLIGCGALTQAIGDWPGGFARVTAVHPDRNAPEIVMMVKAERRTRYDSRKNIGEEMGIFDYEHITFTGGS